MTATRRTSAHSGFSARTVSAWWQEGQPGSSSSTSVRLPSRSTPGTVAAGLLGAQPLHAPQLTLGGAPLATTQATRQNGICRIVDQDKCIGCKSCLKVGCPALMVKNKKAQINSNQCVGCTVCAQVCPKGAISRKES